MISSPEYMQLELSANKVPLKLYRLIGQLPSDLGSTVVARCFLKVVPRMICSAAITDYISTTIWEVIFICHWTTSDMAKQ
jgi:hypothetical protein